MAAKHKEEWKVRSQVESCEVCSKLRSTFKSDQSFRNHRNKCIKRQAEQTKPNTVKEHSIPASAVNQTLDPSVDQSASETHHNGISEDSTVVDVHVKFQPVQHTADPDQSFERNPSLKLPTASDTKRWKHIEAALQETLEGVLLMSGRNKIKSLPINDLVNLYEKTVYDVLLKECGLAVMPQARIHAQRSQIDRVGKFEKKLKIEKKKVQTQYKAAKSGDIGMSEEELKKCSRRFHILLRKHNEVRKVRLDKKKAKDEELQRSKFRSNPWKYGTEVFKPRNAGKPTFDVKTAEEYFKPLYSDAERTTTYKPPPGCARPNMPKFKFDCSPPSIAQLKKAVLKKRNRNAPGLNAIPFIVYKKCGAVLGILVQIMQRVWTEQTVPESWQRAIVILLAKSDDLASPGEFRPIALLNAEGRLFFTLMNARLSTYMLKNGYINTKIQKGFIEKIAGCIEHSEVAHEAMLDAHANKKNLCVSWIDLANAYGSVRHSMILFTLEWYHVPSGFAQTVFTYYEGLIASVIVGSEQTSWFRYQQGVFQGCTLSTMLFDTAFNTMFDSIIGYEEDMGYQFTSADVTLLVSGYADDIGIFTEWNHQNQFILDKVDEWLKWSGSMAAKPRKCRSTAMHHGRPFDPGLKIAGQAMLYIGSKPFKFLGRQLRSCTSEDAAKAKLLKAVEECTRKIDVLPLLGAHKIWIFDAVLMSMISWDLMIHDVRVTFVGQLGALQVRMYKKWAHHAKKGPIQVFFRSPKKWGLGLKEMVPFFKKQQLLKCHLLKNSADPNVQKLYEARAERERQQCQSTNPVIKKTWRPCVELEGITGEAGIAGEAKYRIKFNTAACRSNGDTRGLGVGHCRLGSNTPQTEERAQVLAIFDELEEEKRYLHCLRLEHDCEWVQWDDVLQQDRSWNEVLQLESDTLWRFQISANEDQLPSQSMLKRWKYVEDATCRVCSDKVGSLSHILSCCTSSLSQGRYTWRHDSILLSIYESVREVVNRAAACTKKGITRPKTHVSFTSVTGVEWKTKPMLSSAFGFCSVLEETDDWVLQVDLTLPKDGQKKNEPFPAHIGQGVFVTPSRPDILIYSDKLQTLIYIELTSPWEARMDQAHREKMKKYAKDGLHSIPGWTTIPLCVEVGTRGTTSNTFPSMCKTLGMQKRESVRLRKKVQTIALRCSYFLFLSSKVEGWDPGRPLVRY